MPVIYPITCTFCVIYVHFYGKIKTLSDHVPFMGSCLFVPSIYVSPETTCLNYTRGPWVTRRPSNQGSKKGRYPLWLRGKNLGQGLGFCNFLPGKLPHTGTFYISSVRPPIEFSFFFGKCFYAEPIWGSPPDFSRRFIPTP